MVSATSGYANKEMPYHVVHFVLLVLFSGLATTALVLRFWARKIQKRALALHDYLTVLGLIFALAETGVSVYGCCFAVQRGTVTERLGLQLVFLSPILWVTAVTTIRAAIIFLYIQIFPTRSFRVTCYAALAVNVVFGASAVIADCLVCQPITYRWAPSMVDGSCGDQKALDMCIAVSNLLQDVLAVVLPMPILWGLQMERSRKVGLSCMFGIGILICAITIYRVQVTSTIGDPTNLHAVDTYCRVTLLTSLEALLGVISACLPMLKPIFRKLRGPLFERGTKTIKSSVWGSIPIIMRKSQMQNSSSGKHCSSDLTSTTDSTIDSFWYKRDVEGKYENKGSPKPRLDRVIETGFTRKPHFRHVDPESPVSDV